MAQEPTVNVTPSEPGDGSNLIDTILYYCLMILGCGLGGIVTAVIMGVQAGAALNIKFEYAAAGSVLYLMFLAVVYGRKIGWAPGKPTNEFLTFLSFVFPWVMVAIGGLRGMIYGNFLALFLTTFVSALALGVIAFIVLALAQKQVKTTVRNVVIAVLVFIVNIAVYVTVMGWLWFNSWI